MVSRSTLEAQHSLPDYRQLTGLQGDCTQQVLGNFWDTGDAFTGKRSERHTGSHRPLPTPWRE